MARIAFVLVLAILVGGTAHAVPIQNPSNGHWYEAMAADGISWTSAKNAAAALTHAGVPGYLATITSQAENDWLLANVLPPGSPATGIWIGGCQDPAGTEPAGGWGWCVGTGDLFSYSNWGFGFPDEVGGGLEDYLEMQLGDGKWSDAGVSVPGADQTYGYVVEFSGTGVVPSVPMAGPLLTSGLAAALGAAGVIALAVQRRRRFDATTS